MDDAAYPTEGQPPPEAFAFRGEGPGADAGMGYPMEGQPPPDAYAFRGGGGGMSYPMEGQPPPDAYAFQGGGPPAGGVPGYPGEGQGEEQPAAYAYPDPSYASYQPAADMVVDSMYQRQPTPVDSPKDSFIQSYRSLAYMDSDPFMRYARYGADTCSIDFTDKAKMDARDFLRNTTCEGGATLWDHIRDTLERVLLERPSAPAAFLEDASRRTRAARLHAHKRYPLDKGTSSLQHMQAHELMELAGKAAPADAQWPGGGPPPDWDADAAADDEGDVGAEDDEGDAGPRAKPPRWQDLPRLNRLLQQAGLGLPSDEAYTVGLAMRQLCHDEDVLKARFWGKIFGTDSNYYVLEVDLSATGLAKRAEAEARQGEEEGEGEREGEDARIDPESSAAEGQRLPAEQQKADEGEGEGGPPGEPLPPFWTKPPPPFPPYPQPVVKPAVPVPSEPMGTGLNRKVYYVSSEPSTGAWTALPDVTPAQLQGARLIRRYLSGDLRAPVRSSPAFPGDERQLLRAQIARITAATHVSPMGFFAGPEEGGEGLEEEEEELEGEGDEGGGRGGALQENSRYRPVPLADLLDPSGAAWVHHAEHILRQGRTRWWNPSSPAQPEGEEEEEAKEEAEDEEEAVLDPNAPEPEVGPALLTPLSEDSSLEATPAWTFRAGCSLLPALWGSAVARSNLWPGAWAFALGPVALCVYVGWGVKAVAHSFTPALPGPPQREYPTGPEIMEQTDPTPAEEEEWRLAHQPPPPPQFGEEGLFEEEDLDLAGPDD